LINQWDTVGDLMRPWSSLTAALGAAEANGAATVKRCGWNGFEVRGFVEGCFRKANGIFRTMGRQVAPGFEG